MGVFLGPRQLRAVLLDGSTMPARCRWQVQRGDMPALDADADVDVADGWLLDAWRGTARRTRAGVFVLDPAWVCHDTVALPAGLSPQDRAFQLQAEMAARFSALGDAPVCVLTEDQTVHAVSRQTLMRCDRLARALGLRRVGIGSSAAWDAVQPSAPEASVADDDPAVRTAWRAAQDWLQGTWYGPDWGQHLPVVQTRQWRVWWARCAVSASLGAVAAMGVLRILMLGTDAGVAPTTLAALEQAQAHERARFQVLQAQVRWQDDWQRGLQSDAQVLQVPTRVADVWLDRLQSQDAHWHWQGEAVSPEAMRRLQQALTAARAWHKPPAPVLGEWRVGRAGAVVWHFRLEAEGPQP